ncbi:MAG: prepilin-type N-terminal cleavage/methylation domain-containing protein, partial [Culicoidibacterales bacterium]
MKLKTEKGMTLVELLAVLALTGLLLAVIMQFFMVNLNGMNYQNVRAQLQRETTTMIEQLNTETYSAVNALIEENGQKITFCQLDNEKIEFSRDQNQLLKNTIVIAKNLKNITFSFDENEPNIIDVELNLETLNGRHMVEY